MSVKLPEDPFVLELLPEFIDTWIEDIGQQFDEMIENNQFEELYRMAHTLKGSCFQFGLDEIANIGIQIMEFCKNKEIEKIKSMKQLLLDNFATYGKVIRESK